MSVSLCSEPGTLPGSESASQCILSGYVLNSSLLPRKKVFELHL